MIQKEKMEIVTVLVFAFGLATAYGAKCGNISGNWQNELGSRMSLNVDGSNRISGEYYTAVEANPGAAAFVSNITGLLSRQNDGSLLAFSILFNHGSSLTSWVGQCILCDGKEVLYTTYTFRKHEPDYRKKWATVMVNQNTFWRIEDEAENNLLDATTIRFSSISIPTVMSQRRPGGLDLNGKWTSNDSEELEIFGINGDVLEGITSSCHQSGNFEGKCHMTDVIGRKDGNDMFTAVTLMSTSNKRVRSWTGYISTPFASSVPHILETSWIEHEFSPSCATARNAVRIGAQNFTRIAAGSENIVMKSETFLDKIRKFFTSMF